MDLLDACFGNRDCLLNFCSDQKNLAVFSDADSGLDNSIHKPFVYFGRELIEWTAAFGCDFNRSMQHIQQSVHLVVYSTAGIDPTRTFELELSSRGHSLVFQINRMTVAMDSTEDNQNAKQKKALIIGQLGGFGAGLVVALLFGIDGGKTAISGWVLGNAVAFLVLTQYRLWIRVGVSLITILSVTYVWWPK